MRRVEIVNSETIQNIRENSDKEWERESDTDVQKVDEGEDEELGPLFGLPATVCVNKKEMVFFSITFPFSCPELWMAPYSSAAGTRESIVSNKGAIIHDTSAAYSQGSVWAAMIFRAALIGSCWHLRGDQSLSENWWQSEPLKLHKVLSILLHPCSAWIRDKNGILLICYYRICHQITHDRHTVRCTLQGYKYLNHDHCLEVMVICSHGNSASRIFFMV